VNGLTVWCML